MFALCSNFPVLIRNNFEELRKSLTKRNNSNKK